MSANSSLELNFFLKNKVHNYILEKYQIFPILNIPKDVFKTILWGGDTIKLKYLVVFEIFSKRREK